MRSTYSLKHALLAAVVLAALVAAALPSQAAEKEEPVSAARVGLGQSSATAPVQLGNLKLAEPLVRQKYLAEPDMMRFLRATYSEGCARGLLNQATKQVSMDLKREHSTEARNTAKQLLESQRIWKMNSFEMDALFGASYLFSANYCDCLMREMSDSDLVDPTKGLEVLEGLSEATQKSCERISQEKTEKQLKLRNN